ncbi:MAG: pyruvate flavodoxin/ferredoxin oxidoreductase [Chloroflexi bacterium]|nr:pyruvate flavodoxin/ferredoxin oxidoreductase [Chloroflexota bacterium]
MREFMDGAEAICRGAFASGCNFFAGYPITPASPILLRMLHELPKVGGVGIQGEDEIASIGMCIGAAMAGAKAMTATSGPGLSLYSENIGLAIMGEVPLVIVDVMRLGPATGGATTVSQGDVQFLRWGTSGGFPIIALCPTNAAECYEFAQRAFNLAEQFRTPVFIATDKETVNAQQTVETDAFERIEIVNRTFAPAGIPYVPYRTPTLADTPVFSPLGGEHILRFTTSMHDERGIITKKPASVANKGLHLEAKIEAHRAEFEFVKSELQDGATTLLVSYGVSARSTIEAAQNARRAGKRVSMLIVYSLWPVPERALSAALRGVNRVIVPELNLGQYRLEVERVARLQDPRPKVIGVNRIDGDLISPLQIEEQIL